MPVVGLEPSCLLTLRDEFLGLVPGEEARALAAQAKLFDEFMVEEQAAGRFALPLHPIAAKKAVLHTHCHQKAFAAGGASAKALQLVPGLDVATFDSTCCGMAGAFGYEAEHYELSLGIGELGVLPRLRQAGRCRSSRRAGHELPPPDRRHARPPGAPPRARARRGERLEAHPSNPTRLRANSSALNGRRSSAFSPMPMKCTGMP